MVSMLYGTIGLVISCTGIVVGNASGAGAGGFVVPCLFIFLNYNLSQAVAVWNAVILIISLWRIGNSMLTREKHPEGSKSIIDFNSVLIFQPSLFIGLECGFITMSILPEGVKLIGFFLMLSALTAFSFKKAYARLKAENEAKKPLLRTTSLEMGSSIEEAQAQDESEAYCPVKKLLLNGLGFVLLTVSHLIIGSPKAASLIGIAPCSKEYWIGLFIYFALLLSLLYYSYQIVRKERAWNMERGIKPLPSEFEWTSELILNTALLAIMAGFFSSSYGVGGGIILNMILIYKGVDPQVVTATTMLSIIFICLSTTTVYSITHVLPLDAYSISLFIMTLPLTIISYGCLKKILAKHSSVILFILAYALGISAVLVLIFGFYKAYCIDHNPNVWRFGSMCHKAF
eukprot:TRINITY_DN9971_c0_g4_i2.p1 TRINITY_DN9971_c0_g4~~TRINITY_DN9971_c0_g4_i2.p1  ORF type:complete len:401 (+),score=59.03 TRINITY_DN9971_c0_g4_i2:151-1353(+)